MLKSLNFKKAPQAVLSHSLRISGSAAALANEYYHSNMEFSIINGDSSKCANLFGYSSKGLYGQKTPIIAVPASQLRHLEFINTRIHAVFLRNEVVDIPLRNDFDFSDDDYIRNWTYRLEHRRKAVILPEKAKIFVAQPIAGRHVLAGTAQDFVVRKKLDTALYNIFASVSESGCAKSVFYYGALDISPSFARILSMNIEESALRFKD